MKTCFVNRLFKLKIIAVLCFIMLLVNPFLYAGTPPLEDHVRGENKNVFGLYLGDKNTQNQNAFTYGFEYHRIISMPVGLSLIVEDTPHNNEEGERIVEVISLLKLNSFHNITAGCGPGLEFTQNMTSKLFGRFSAGYIFKFFSDIEVTPTIDLDVALRSPNTWLFGVVMAKQF